MNKEKLKADIVMWLYLNGGAFKSNLHWRAEFLDYLDILFEDSETDIPHDNLKSGTAVQAILESPNLPTHYPVKIDYSKSLKQMIKAGKYDWVNKYINAHNFPTYTYLNETGKIQKDIYLMGYDEDMTSEEVEEHLEEKGLRACTLPELLALGAQYPELQKENTIVALGSRWRSPVDDVFVPVLFGIEGSRELYLGWCGAGWSQYCRFAAVAK